MKVGNTAARARTPKMRDDIAREERRKFTGETEIDLSILYERRVCSLT